MSLLTDFNAKQVKIQTAKEWTDLILNHTVAYENINSWQCRYYNKTKTYAPILSDVDNLIPTKTAIRADTDTATNWNWGNNYIGYMQCYVKCNKDYTLSCQFATDDLGRIYINHVSKAITTSAGTMTDCSLNFKKGWNLVQIMFQEGTGADYGVLNTKLSTQTFVDAMYANIRNDITSL